MLIEAGFMECMGFARAEIVALLQRSETYRQLSVRLRPLTIGAVPLGLPTKASESDDGTPVAGSN